MSTVIHTIVWKSKKLNDYEDVLSLLGYSDYDLNETIEIGLANKQVGIRAIGLIKDFILIVDANLANELIYHPFNFDFSSYAEFELAAFSYNDQIGAYGFSYFKNGKVIRSVTCLENSVNEIYGKPLEYESLLNVRANYSKGEIEELIEIYGEYGLDGFFYAEKVSKAYMILFQKLTGLEFFDILDCDARRITDLF